MQLISYLSATPNPLQGKAPLLTIFHSLRSGFFIQHLGTCVLQHRKEHLNTLILSDTIPYYNNLINLQESFSLAMAYSGVMPLPGAVDDSPVPGDSGTLRKLCRCRNAVFIQICDSICVLTDLDTIYWTNYVGLLEPLGQYGASLGLCLELLSVRPWNGPWTCVAAQEATAQCCTDHWAEGGCSLESVVGWKIIQDDLRFENFRLTKETIGRKSRPRSITPSSGEASRMAATGRAWLWDSPPRGTLLCVYGAVRV